MKCSEYLWKRIQLDTLAPEDWSPERVQGEMRAQMIQTGDTQIINDVTGKPMNEREANSIYGRNYDKLNEAYKMNQKSLFEVIVANQQMSDEEWEKAKEEAEKEAEEVTEEVAE